MQLELNFKTVISGIVSLVTLIGVLIGYAMAADQKYVDITELSQLQQQMSVERLVDRRTDYQDRIDNIEDKKIDGTATPSDLKKMHRYNTRVKEINQKLNSIKN